MKFNKTKACSCSLLVSFIVISLLFFPKCNGKSRPGVFQYRRFVPGSTTNPWRSYGSGSGGVLGGIGGEHGDLSYRSSRNTEQTPAFSYYFGPFVAPRSTRGYTNYWSTYSKPYTCDRTCSDGTCLPESYVCDGYAQCWDGSDEKGCACKQIIAEEKTCDGYKDCPNGEDELDCVYGCQSNEFTCDTHNSGSKVKCVPMSKRCDGYNDCPHGNDEHNCFRMVDLYDEEQRGLMSSGILQKRIGDNQWHTVCKTASSSHHITQFAEKACEQIIGHVDGAIQVNTKSVSQMKLQMTKQQAQQLKYVRLAEIEAKFAVLGACASDLVYEVICPPPQCGGHGNYENYASRRRRRRETEKEKLDEDMVDLEEEEELFENDDDLFELEDEIDDENEDKNNMEMIVGGYATEEMKWPFLVGIFRDGEFYCGGSIINAEWILTAAHCCHGYDKHVFEVQAGMQRRQSWSPYEQTRMVTEIYVHDEYNSKVFANDIALYKLDRPLHLSKYVTPACLPSGGSDDPYGGQNCKVAGWGDLSESGSGPDHMQEVALPILGKCKETFTRDSHQICAGYTEGGMDACQGDSGGPLMCINSAGKPIVNGVVSFGRGCARANEAGAYTRVSAYLDWIEEICSGKKTRPSYYPRPKECTEKCYKPGGECLYPEEKCSGKVDCLGAEDELNCSHPVTRAHEEYTATATVPYWSTYPAKAQQTPYYTSPQQAPHGVLTRSGGGQVAPAYYPVLPQPIIAPPPQQTLYPIVNYGTGRIRSTSHHVHKTLGSCDLATQFQCSTRTEVAKLATCMPKTMQCDRSFQCSDQSDELNCMTVTTNFREPLSPSSIMQMSEVKGYVLTKFKGNEWHPLVTKSWTLTMGQQMCQVLLGTDSAKLVSMEAINMEDLASRLLQQNGLNIMQGTAVKLDENANENMLLSNSKMFGHPAKMSTFTLDSEHLTTSSNNENLNEMMLGFVRCAK